MRILVWEEKLIKRINALRDKFRIWYSGQYQDILNFVSYWKLYVANKFFTKDVPLNTLYFTLRYTGSNVQVTLASKHLKNNPKYIPTMADFNIEQLVEDIDFQFKIHRAMNSLRRPPSDFEGLKGWSRRMRN